MSEYGDRLKSEYESVQPIYMQFTKNLSDLLEKLLADEGVDHLPIESRTKSVDSFYDKVELPEKSQKYKVCGDLTDLSGVRITSYLQNDRNKICELIEKFFKIDEVNSTNKDDGLNADQFGYRSNHYVISYSDDRVALPEFNKFRDLKAEIQVRTLLQHTWAAIDWKLRYKGEIDAPKELRRRLFRISALLELADDEFSALSQGIDSIRQSYKGKIAEGDFRIDINRESVELFFDKDESVKKLIKLAEKSGYSIAPLPPNSRNPYHAFLSTLAGLDFLQIDQLRDSLSNFNDKDSSKLKDVINVWRSPGKPGKLVLDLPNLVRMSIILSVPVDKVEKILTYIPFGPYLQKSILQVVGLPPMPNLA